MEVGLDFVCLEFAGEIFGFLLAVEESDDDRTDIETATTEKFDKAEDFGLVRNHVVGANLGMFNGVSINTENNFGVVFEFLKKLNLEVGKKTRESAGGVLVVDEFAAEFEVEFVEHFDAASDFLLLDFEIFVGIKTFFHKPPLNYRLIIANVEKECKW